MFRVIGSPIRTHSNEFGKPKSKISEQSKRCECINASFDFVVVIVVIIVNFKINYNGLWIRAIENRAGPRIAAIHTLTHIFHNQRFG